MPKKTKPQTTDFGRWLADAMAARKLNQKEFVAESGIAQSTVSSYLSGARRPRRSSDVEQLAKALYMEDGEYSNSYAMFFDAGLLAAGLAPENRIKYLVREETVDYIYQPLLRDIEQAAQAGHLDAEAVLRIRKQIQVEAEEAARRRIAVEEENNSE
jgi:transcriptional regulator with XRE-family HTH domain